MLPILWLVALAGQVSANPATSIGPAAAEILETRSPAYAASVTRFSAEGLAVRIGNQPRSIPYDQLLRTKFASAESKAVKGKLQVELIDGSQLRCQQITSDGKTVQLTISEGFNISLPTSQVANCLAQPLEASLSRQWENMISSRIAGDVLVLQRSAEALDKIEGVIVEINDSQVKFEFDGQTIPVARTKLAGWRFFSSSKDKPGKLLPCCATIWAIAG